MTRRVLAAALLLCALACMALAVRLPSRRAMDALCHVAAKLIGWATALRPGRSR